MKSISTYNLIGIAIIVVVIKLWYRELEVDQPVGMLAPVTSLVEVAVGEQARFVSGEGYCFFNLNIIINKSCSGINFLCICFFLLGFTACGYPFSRNYTFYLLMFPLLILSYGITVLVNFSRILFAVFINMQSARLGIPLPNWFHMAEGTFVYLFSLILIYLSIHILCTRKLTYPNEKSI